MSDYDASLYIGGDLSISPSGDIALATGVPLGEQRVLRRLLTNAGDYIWHLDYGAGLGQMIGTPANALAISGIIRGQISQEAAVAQTPTPAISVTTGENGIVTANIQYVDADTGAPAAVVLPS